MIVAVTLTILAVIVSLEAVLFFFIQISVNRHNQGLKEARKTIEKILEDGVKTHTALIHLGHQMRTIQHDLDILRKNGILKQTNGHHPKAHA